MQNWTRPEKEWFSNRPLTIDGQTVKPLWHTSQFPGEVELVVEPRDILEDRHEVALSINKSGKEGASYNGYVFRYMAGRPTSGCIQSSKRGQNVLAGTCQTVARLALCITSMAMSILRDVMWI